MFTAVIALIALVPSALADTGVAVDTAFDQAYYADPWTGVCASGTMQSPVDLPAAADGGALPSVPENLVTDIIMPVITAPVTVNIGSAVQVTWDPTEAFDMEADGIFPMVAAGGDSISDIILKDGVKADYMLKMVPLQIHWHETSEHSIGGLLAPMEAHIVTAVGPGEAPADWGCDAVWEGGEAELEKCLAVFSVLYLSEEDTVDPPYIQNLLASFPNIAGSEEQYPEPTFNLNDVLPDDKSYFSYVGSLTTPPCAEGLRWHVFTEFSPISLTTIIEMENKLANTTDLATGERQLYRHNNRPVQPLNDRTIYHMSTSSSSSDRTRRPRGYGRGGL